MCEAPEVNATRRRFFRAAKGTTVDFAPAPFQNRYFSSPPTNPEKLYLV